MEIKLPTKGYFFLIDEEDFDLIQNYKWFLRKVKNINYVIGYKKGSSRKKIKFVYLHRILLSPIPEGMEIDHKNHNGLVNRRCNISIVNKSDQIKNRRKHRGTSKYWGVSRHLGYCWVAKININGKQQHLGCFEDEKEAALAYNNAAIKTGNHYYRLNDL